MLEARLALPDRVSVCHDPAPEVSVKMQSETSRRGRRHAAIGVCAAVLLLWPGAGVADESSDEDESIHTVETVVPEERSVDDARFPSGFVSRVEVDDEARMGRDLGDALEAVPGINVRRSAGFGRPAFATVRGGNARQLAVSLNGMRISAPAGVGFDVGSLSLAGIEAVDVHRGGAGTVQGAGALTGALELHTGLPDEPGWQGAATSFGGSFETFGAGAQGSWRGESAAMKLDANWRQSDGDFSFVDRQDTVSERINNDHRNIGVSANGLVELDAHRIEPVVIYERGEGGVPGPSEFQQRFAEARLDTSRLIGQLNWKRRGLAAGEWGALDGRGLIGYQRRETDYSNPTGYLGGVEVRDTSTLDSFEALGELGSWLAFGNLAHLTGNVRLQDYGSVHEDDAGASTVDASRATVAAALSNELLVLGEDVSLIAGLRVEHVSDARDIGGSSLVDAGADELGERSWTPLIPSGGVIWRAMPGLKLKANVARTYRTPDLDELYLDMAGLRGDPTLEAERALAVDAGFLVGSQDGPATLEAVFFRNDIDEIIQFVAAGAYLFEAQNLGSGTSQGVEASLAVRPLDRLAAHAAYTYTDARLDGMAEGVRMPGQPVHRVAARAGVDFGGLGVLEEIDLARLFAEVDWRSRVYLDSFGNISNPPFWTVDAGARVRPLDWLEVALNARNLTDNRRGADSLQRPLPGRAFYLSVKVSGP